jgi:hypothetical protein
MPDYESVDHYKDHKIYIFMTTMDDRSFGTTTFSVRERRGEDWKLVESGLIQETFSNKQDAEAAAFAEARRWVDEHPTPGD